MNIYIGESPLHDKGVFAARKIEAGEVIESCYVIVLSEIDKEVVKNTILNDYCYLWGEDSKKAVVVLGNGSIFNHSYAPNCVYEKDFRNERIIFRALNTIQPNEEITINYNWDPKDKSKLWFEVKG